MELHLSEESLWASALAARLRVLQANFADDDSASRKGFIVQEIEGALKGCVPDKRKALLETLATRFPSWQAAAPAQVSTPRDEAPEQPEALLERLLEVLPGLPAGLRADFIERLKRAGLIAEQPGAGLSLAPELLKRIG